MKDLRCEKDPLEYRAIHECHRPIINEKVHDNYWNLKQFDVDTKRDLDDIKAELRKHGSQFEEQKQWIADTS